MPSFHRMLPLYQSFPCLPQCLMHACGRCSFDTGLAAGQDQKTHPLGFFSQLSIWISTLPRFFCFFLARCSGPTSPWLTGFAAGSLPLTLTVTHQHFSVSDGPWQISTPSVLRILVVRNILLLSAMGVILISSILSLKVETDSRPSPSFSKCHYCCCHIDKQIISVLFFIHSSIMETWKQIESLPVWQDWTGLSVSCHFPGRFQT